MAMVIEAGADIRDALKGFKNLADAAETGANSAVRSIADMEAEIRQLFDRIRNSTDVVEMGRLSDRIKQLETRIKNTKLIAFMNQVGDKGREAGRGASALAKGVGEIPGPSQAASRAVVDFGRILQDLPFGPTGIANNLEGAALSMKNLSEQAKAAGTSVGKVLLQSLMGGSGLIAAISIVSAAMVFATAGTGAWTRMFGGAKGATEEATKALEEYRKMVESVTSELAKNQTEALSLISALQSGTLDKSQREEALKELKRINHEYFGQLREEEGLIKGLNQAYKNYVNALKDIGRTKAVESQLTKLFDQKLQLELKIDRQFQVATNKDVQTTIGKLKKQLEQINKELEGQKVDLSLKANAEEFSLQGVKDEVKSVQGLQDFGTEQQKKKQKELNSLISRRIQILGQISALERGDTIMFLDDQTKAIKEQIEAIDLQIEGLSSILKNTGKFTIDPQIKAEKKNKDQFEFLFEFLPFDPNGKLKPENRAKLMSLVDKFSDDFRDIFKGVDFRLDAKTAEDALNAARSWWAAFQNGIFLFQPKGLFGKALSEEELQTELSIVPSVEISDEAFDRLKKNYLAALQPKSEELDMRLDREGILKSFRQDFRILGAEFPKLIEIDGPFGQKILVSPEASINIEKLEKGLEEARRRVVDRANAFREAVTSAINSSIQSAITSFSEGIGEALAGGGLDKAFASIASTMGNFLQELGKLLIKEAIQIQLIKNAFQAIVKNPALALAVGAGLIAVGGAIKKAVLPKPPAFAEGGLVFGPTLGLVGEGRGTSRNNPEVIAPLDKLQEHLGKAGSGFPQYLPAFELRGATLRAWYEASLREGRRYI